MAHIYVGSVIKNLRQRKKWQQEKLLDMLQHYEPSIFRLESGVQMPGHDSFRIVMDTLGTPMDETLCPHLDNQPMEVYTMRDRLLQALDNKDLHEAQNLFDETISMMHHEGPVNRQFVLSQQARILELQGRDAAEIIPLVVEGIKLTFVEFNEDSPGDDVLIFEEPELFHTMARLYARLGRIQDSIRMLKQTYTGLQRLSIGERERDRRTVPILLSLAELLINASEYQEAIKVCDVGINISATRNLGKGMLEFLSDKAEALLILDPNTKVEHLLRMAFAGHILLGERDKAYALLECASRMHGITVNTYGMENAEMVPVNKAPYARGLPVACASIGEMIRILRKDAKLTLEELSQGICSTANLSKIEKGEIKGHMFYIEPILQRLGRDPSLYCNFFLLKKDFQAIEIRDMIHMLLVHRKHDKAAELLEELKTYDAFKNRANLQFVRSVEIELQIIEQKDLSPSDVEKMLLEALRLTCPKFDEEMIKHYPLTHNESILINKLAIHYMQTSKLSRAANIFAALIANLNKRYVDEFEKARLYASVMFNYSTCLGRAGRRIEALEIVETAIIFERCRGRLSALSDLVFNKAYNFYMIGKKQESLPYFILSYYGTCLFEVYGNTNNIAVTSKFIFENFGLSLTS